MNEWSRLKLVDPSAAAPVTLDEAKRHLRVFHDDEDDTIQIYLDAAIAMIEGPNGIGIVLSPQTWRLSLDHFPCEVTLPMGPVTAINSVTYTDNDGVEAIVTTWRADLDTQPVRVWPARDAAWPSVNCEPGAVKIEFDAGYEVIPPDLKAAVLLIAGHLYEHREAVADRALAELPMAVDSILNRYRVGRFA